MSIRKELEEYNVVEDVLQQADIYGLRAEVMATAIAIIRDNPKTPTGSAYAMAAYDWDIGY
jgi:hypothetical protein